MVSSRLTAAACCWDRDKNAKSSGFAVYHNRWSRRRQLLSSAKLSCTCEWACCRRLTGRQAHATENGEVMSSLWCHHSRPLTTTQWLWSVRAERGGCYGCSSPSVLFAVSTHPISRHAVIRFLKFYFKRLMWEIIIGEIRDSAFAFGYQYLHFYDGCLWRVCLIFPITKLRRFWLLKQLNDMIY